MPEDAIYPIIGFAAAWTYYAVLFLVMAHFRNKERKRKAK